MAAARAALLLACAIGPARGQTSADLTLVSQYAARGVALSAGPAVQLRVDHDTDDGWYAGGFASSATVNNRNEGQLIAYAGRAGRLSSTLSWDAGVTRTLFLRDRYWDYTEFQAGLTLRGATARLFYSPSYYAQGRSVYLDLSGAYGLADHLSLAMHAGVLHPLGAAGGHAATYGATYGNGYGSGGTRARIDARLALVADLRDVSLQAGWQHLWRADAARVTRARAATASVSLRF